MKILHILDHSIPLHSGYTFRTRAILEQQHARGWETFHVTSPKHNLSAPDASDEEVIDGLHFYRTAVPRRLWRHLPVLNQWMLISAMEKRLKTVAKAVRPDILHAHSPALNGEAAVRVGRKLGIPVVYEVRAFWEDAAVDHGTSTEEGMRYRLTRGLETRVLRNVDAVTTICEGLRKDIVVRGVPADSVTVIPNAVDVERFQGAGEPDGELKASLGLGGNLALGFIGSFYAYEGLPLLLEALPEILDAIPDVRVLLVGGGPDASTIRETAGRLRLGDAVVFTGRVPHDEVQRYYDLVDVLVYPRFSMRLTELVTPLKPLEAMAQNKIVVASDVGGHKELITDGKNGRLFKAGDAHSLAETVLDVMNTPARWSAYRAAGREFVETERNWPSSVARYEAIYKGLLEGMTGNRRLA